MMAPQNLASDTRVDEIADGIFRICTPVPPSVIPGGFTFNQYLIVDDEPLLFHTGSRRMFPLVKAAIETVIPVAKLRHIGFSHLESDECGAINDFLAVAPDATPLCGMVAGLISLGDSADRPARILQDGETLSLGKHNLKWFDTPHMPHGWDCGFPIDTTTRTLLCGDLFTQGGHLQPALTESDILAPSEAFRGETDYFSHTRHARAMLERLAAEQPTTLACMHGSAWTGDGSRLLMELADVLER